MIIKMMMLLLMLMMIIIIINYFKPLKRAGSAKSEINVFISRSYDIIIKTENDFKAYRRRTFWQLVADSEKEVLGD